MGVPDSVQGYFHLLGPALWACLSNTPSTGEEDLELQQPVPIQSSQLAYELYNLKISFHSIQQHKFKCVILYFELELVVLHATLSKFGNFLVYAWRQCGGLNKDLSITVLQGQTHSCTSGHTEISLSLYAPIWNIIHSSLHTNSKHALELTKHGRCCMQIDQLPTKSHVELKDDSDIFAD